MFAESLLSYRTKCLCFFVICLHSKMFATRLLLFLQTRPLIISFVCVNHIYIDCLIKKLENDNSLGNTTYTPTTVTKEEILYNHMSVLCSFRISTNDEELDLPSLYCIPILHNILGNTVILLSLPASPRNLFRNY